MRVPSLSRKMTVLIEPSSRVRRSGSGRRCGSGLIGSPDVPPELAPALGEDAVVDVRNAIATCRQVNGASDPSQPVQAEGREQPSVGQERCQAVGERIGVARRNEESGLRRRERCT